MSPSTSTVVTEEYVVSVGEAGGETPVELEVALLGRGPPAVA